MCFVCDVLQGGANTYSCPPNSNSAAGSSVQTQCICNPGYRSVLCSCRQYLTVSLFAAVRQADRVLLALRTLGAHQECNARAQQTRNHPRFPLRRRRASATLVMWGRTARPATVCSVWVSSSHSWFCLRSVCPANFYCTGGNSQQACPANSNSPTGSATLSSCVCNANFYGSSSSGCLGLLSSVMFTERL